jgi:nucleoside-diphosphate-sugar epimerase
MYGCNKLYCEHLGRYYAHHHRQLLAERTGGGVDFRAVRFPGLISAATIPSGGTSDYAPEMIHAAARTGAYACFVRPDTRIPFMAMPDAVRALIALAHADRTRLTTSVYNVAAFAPSADEIREETLRAFPRADITYHVDDKRQRIVDSWPSNVDDDLARRDWGFAPTFGFHEAFRDYLAPMISSGRFSDA